MPITGIINSARRTDFYHAVVVPRALGILVEDATKGDPYPSLCYTTAEIRAGRAPVDYETAVRGLREWRRVSMYDVCPCLLVSLFDGDGLFALAETLRHDDDFRCAWSSFTDSQPKRWLDGDIDREVVELADRIAEAADAGDIALGRGTGVRS